MTDKIRLGAFLLPSAGATIAQFERGFAGQNPNYYQNTLRDCARLIRQLDDIGFDFVAFSEHHFHLEGLELSNNPILLGSWAAGLTRKLRIGQMGNVLPARNPLLMAEDLAMLDHFSEGRMMAGFARGYQARHVATIGQKFNASRCSATKANTGSFRRPASPGIIRPHSPWRPAWSALTACWRKSASRR
jgi:alkanesulfonate monooxygenase SsuD/methylene tetrahydromethanopterin reductase-like flavin-dependent oxidoreductase (luciferase family)